MKNFKNKKGIISFAITTLLLGGSIGGTVFAANNTDVVKKDVLMTEKVELNGSHSSKEKVHKADSSALVNENQAVDTAKDALKRVFDVKINDSNYLIQTDYFDKSKNNQSYEGKAVWVVTFKKKQMVTTKDAIEFNSAFIDADTGEVLSLSSHQSKDTKPTKNLSKDAAQSMAIEFIESKKLNNGAAIKEVHATPIKNIIEVEVKLDNSKEMTVVINHSTNKIEAWQNH